MSESAASQPRAAEEHRLQVEAGDDSRLDVFVARHLDISRNQAATLIAAGKLRAARKSPR
jgi:RNA-binding protein YlmH